MGGTVIIKMMQVHNAGQTTVRLRCPACRHKGTFENIGQQDYSNGTLRAGMRRCPDPTCHALVFVVLEGNGALRESFPADRFGHHGSEDAGAAVPRPRCGGRGPQEAASSTREEGGVATGTSRWA